MPNLRDIVDGKTLAGGMSPCDTATVRAGGPGSGVYDHHGKGKEITYSYSRGDRVGVGRALTSLGYDGGTKNAYGREGVQTRTHPDGHQAMLVHRKDYNVVHLTSKTPEHEMAVEDAFDKYKVAPTGKASLIQEPLFRDKNNRHLP